MIPCLQAQNKKKLFISIQGLDDFLTLGAELLSVQLS